MENRFTKWFVVVNIVQALASTIFDPLKIKSTFPQTNANCYPNVFDLYFNFLEITKSMCLVIKAKCKGIYF